MCSDTEYGSRVSATSIWTICSDNVVSNLSPYTGASTKDSLFGGQHYRGSDAGVNTDVILMLALLVEVLMSTMMVLVLMGALDLLILVSSLWVPKLGSAI
jgi:hypothetical protein